MHYRSDDLPARELVPGFHGKFFHGQSMTLARWQVVKDSRLPVHQHPHEQITSVISGTFEMTVGDKTQILQAGDTAVIPAEVPHSGVALTDCQLVDAFSPPRDDYR